MLNDITSTPKSVGAVRLRTLTLAAIALSFVARTAAAAEEYPLWPNGTPNAVGTEAADKPTLTYHPALAERANGSAVVVCPGGGYGGLALGHEGQQIAAWLTQRGVAAFVLKYRLGPRYRHPAMRNDVRRALRTVRARAEEWKVDPTRIGVWGFSAGGHLAATAATHFAPGNKDAKDPIERVSSRPDFAILAYPVISLDAPHTHRGSQRNLLGDKPAAELLHELSLENAVTKETPPTFLFHTTEDKAVPPENSIAFYLALRKAGVAAELHIYEKGRHGVGLAPKSPILSTWSKRLEDWLSLRDVVRR